MDLDGKPDDWLNDANNFDHMVHTVNALLNALRPAGAAAQEGEDPQNLAKTDRFLGDINAAAIADDLLAADPALPPDQRHNPFQFIKADLGDVADRFKSLAGSGIGRGERARKPRADAFGRRRKGEST